MIKTDVIFVGFLHVHKETCALHLHNHKLEVIQLNIIHNAVKFGVAALLSAIFDTCRQLLFTF